MRMISTKAVAFTTLGLVVWVGLVGLAIVFGTRPAEPHEATPTAAAPQGWTYPFSCCSGYDCREVKDTAIIEGARGYEIRLTGELIPMTDPKVKPSPDGRFHHCTQAGAADGKTICLFVPPRGF